ncbi:MAG: protein kinase [Myxococcales bacterium]|nr:protein kinase [Myxococcales bacterium]MBK7195374.1 protein kinase [Myxococcales bacterium]MBP6846497.1 protein kinase [Kofleriaceae bacterium]
MATPLVIAERFELEELAESGGMGSVYRARDRLTGNRVAVKLLAKANQRWAERFRREALALAELAHPAIVRYVAHGLTPTGEPYLAMEWLSGEPLSARLRRGRLSLPEACDLGIRISDALTFAHAAGVIHRDLKPANVFLVDGDCRGATLLDFGVARMRTLHSDTTRTGDRVGTPRYMAPEQVRAARAVDWRCDLWSLGCVLYTCLAGRPPFSAPDEMATWGKILLEEAPVLSVARPDAPPPLVALVRRLLEKEPTLRPASAAVVANELRRIERPEGPDSTGITSVGVSLATSGEHRRVALVMIGPLRAATDDDDGDDSAEARPSELPHVELAASADRHGGTFEPLAHGGAIITFAGSPAATDLVARAARCALEARAACGAAIALASGRGSAGNLSVGEAIERAAELLRRAPASADRERAVIVDEVSAALLGPRFEVTAGGALRAERPDDGVRTILGRATPTVGRERELNLLVQACRDSADEPAAAALVVVGDAGVGKSRLRHEVIARLGGSARVWSGRGDPVRAGSPFSLLGSALRRRLGVDDIATAAARTAAVRRVQVAVEDVGLDDAERVTAFLAELIGAPPVGMATAQLAAARRQPRLMNDQLRRAFLELVAAELARGPIVWTFDDLHWGDAPSIELVDEALRAFADRPLAVIGFARPEVEGLFPRLWAQRGATQVRLGPLAKKAATRLAEGVLGVGAAPATIAAVVERAGGNAFFLEELLRAAAGGEVDRLPETVVAMVQVRLEALAAPARQVLRAAAVLGSRFAVTPLAALLGSELPERELDQLLADLVARELLVAEDLDRRELSFRHDTIREAAYGTLLDSDRQLAHRTAGLWLEAQHERDALTVAQHLEAGGEEARAALWYRYAAEHALEAGDPHAVIDRAARGLECGAVEHERGGLLLLACIAHDWLGETEATERCALGALDAAREGSAVWLRAAAELAVVAGRLGNHHLLVGVARDLARARAGEARRERVVALAIVASELLLVGHVDQARRLLERIEDLHDAWSTDGVAGAWRLRARGIAALVGGDSVAALTLMQASTTQMEEVGARRDLASGLTNIGFLEIMVGRFGEAEATLRRGLALANELGAVRITTVATQNLALALFYRGKPGEGLRTAVLAEQRARDQDSLRIAGAAMVYQARCLLALDRAAEARAVATRALEVLAAMPPTLAYAYGAVAAAALAEHDVAAAAIAATTADRLLEELGAIEEGDAFVRLVLAQVRVALGEPREAARIARGALARIEAAAEGLSDPSARASFAALPEHVALADLAALTALA